MKAVIGRTTTQNIRVQTTGGLLQTSTPITLKNQVTEISSIEDIRDVAEVEVVAGATLVYNPINDKYEVKQITQEDISGDINLDGGEF
jgi:hypothetical protein